MVDVYFCFKECEHKDNDGDMELKDPNGTISIMCGVCGKVSLVHKKTGVRNPQWKEFYVKNNINYAKNLEYGKNPNTQGEINYEEAAKAFKKIRDTHNQIKSDNFIRGFINKFTQ